MSRTTASPDRRILKLIRGYTLMDDAFMQACFRDNRESVETVLRVVLAKEDLVVTDVATQKRLHNLYGRAVCLDIAATDSAGRAYDIEIQRETAGASPERARLNSSLMDANVARPGTPFGKLPETVVIFIAATDVLGGNKPLYTIIRRIDELKGKPAFGDGSRIVYVNGAKRRGKTALAKLMHDFFCADPDRMYYPALAERARYFKKDEKGIREMYSEIERLERVGEQRGLERGRKEGRKEGRMEEQKAGVSRMLAMEKYSIEEIAQVFNVGLDQVRALAAEQGKG